MDDDAATNLERVHIIKPYELILQQFQEVLAARSNFAVKTDSAACGMGKISHTVGYSPAAACMISDTDCATDVRLA